MEKLVKQFITHAITGEDILNICNGEANLVTTSSLKNYSSIKDVLGKWGACILLYDRKDGSPGHWSCIIKHPGKVIEFFCSYGLKPDQANKFIKGKPYLSKLLEKSGCTIIYNDYQLQKYKNDVNVCGRYIGCRIALREMPLTNFIDIFTDNKYFNPDFWITAITLFCEN